MGADRDAAPPRLALPIVALIAAGAFLAGHYSSPRAAAADRARPAADAAAAAATAGALAAQQGSGGGAGGSGAPLREMGALGDEWLRASGLLRLRPPLAPAASGSPGYLVQPLQVLSWHPRIVLFPNFIDAARCDHIIELARAKLRGSDLAWRPDEEPRDDDQDMRTSEGAFLAAADDKDGVLAWLEEKIAAVTYLPVSHGEVRALLLLGRCVCCVWVSGLGLLCVCACVLCR